MRVEEAKRIEDLIIRHIPRAKSPGQSIAINLGSGIRKPRGSMKPYIEEFTITPLIDRGYKVVHSDAMHGEGIDITGDIFDGSFKASLAELRAEVILFCNVLEHLPDHLRPLAPIILREILTPRGHLIVSVPYSYPYHADPIDTMYRPSPQDLNRLFWPMNSIESSVVVSSTYKDEFVRGGFERQLKKVLRLCFPFIRPKRWLSHLHRMAWLRRPYKITVGIFQK